MSAISAHSKAKCDDTGPDEIEDVVTTVVALVVEDVIGRIEGDPYDELSS